MAAGDIPPDEVIEIALWDRFGWGPDQTDNISASRLRKIFIILEQQRVSKDAIENLGPPNEDKLIKKRMQTEASRSPGKMMSKVVDQTPVGSKVIGSLPTENNVEG